jgi:hypothetical protein
MTEICYLAEQKDLPGLALLPEGVKVTSDSLANLLRRGWDHPLLVLGNALDKPEIPALIQRTYHNPAPMLILPPLPQGKITALLKTSTPVTVAYQRAELVELIDGDLQATLGRNNFSVYCTEFIETTLRTGALAVANNQPVIWTYRPIRTATPVVWIAAQLLLVSARTDPVDREDLLAGLLIWAETQAEEKRSSTRPLTSTEEVDPALLRALVVAWSVRPDLSDQALLDWLKANLFVELNLATLRSALQGLQNDGVLDGQNRPQVEPLSKLVNDWGLRAWIREARRLEAHK